ncbi:MAG: sigma-70 family RNA polymerase sigma factor [Polyangiaceae bacterium]
MDDELIQAARAGDPAALAELMRVRRAQVVRYAMRLCVSREDAEDATQEALIALSRHVGALREAAALSRWLFLAVRTHCVRLARRSLRHALSLDDGTPVALEGPSPEDQLVDTQLRGRISAILGAMAPAYREVLVRRDILGESNEEAAAALGLTMEALKSRLHRARAEVKRELLATFEPPKHVAQKRKTRLGSIV